MCSIKLGPAAATLALVPRPESRVMGFRTRVSVCARALTGHIIPFFLDSHMVTGEFQDGHTGPC